MAVAGNIVIELKLDDDKMVVGVAKAGAVLRQFQSTLGQTATSVKRLEEAHTSFGHRLHNLVATAGYMRFAVMDIHDLFIRLPMSILKTSGELERMQVMMKGLSKSFTETGREADKIRDFNFITNFARTAPFSIDALADSFVKLKTAGIDPTDGSMKALVDSVAKFGGTSDTMKRASIAIQQMVGKGVISMEELRQQLGEAIPTAMQDMADGMGVSMSRLAEIVKTGTLKAGPALEKMFLQMQINNAGAAAAMMNTWSGALSRLETDWKLTTKTIADSGFGDAAKKAVEQFSALLASADFHDFAISFGKGLGGAVQAIAEVAQAIVKYRDEIALTIKMWVAYKALTAGLIPLARALQSQYDSLGSTYQKSIGKALENTANKRADAIVEAQLTADRLKNTQAELAARLSADQQQLASMRARHAETVAAETAMAAKLAATRGGVHVPGMSGFQSRATGFQVTAQHSAQAIALRKEMDALQLSTNNTARALEVATAASTAAHGRFFALTNQSGLYTAAAKAASLATAGLGAAMNFLGGPIGVLILAVTGLVWWYQKAARESEESAARQKRAAKGMAQAGDLAGAIADQAEAQRALAAARAKAEDDMVRDSTTHGARGIRQKVESERAADRADVERRINALKVAETAVKDARGLVADEAVRDEVNAANVRYERASRSLDEVSQREILESKSRQAKALAKEKEGSKEYQAVKDKFRDEQIKITKDGLLRQIAAETAAETAAIAEAKRLGAGNDSAQLAIARGRADARKKLEDELAGITTRQNSTVVFGDGKKEKKGGAAATQVEDAFKGLADRMRAENEGLKAELDSMVSTLSHADKVARKLTEIDTLFAAGAYKTVGKDGKARVMSPKNEQDVAAVGSLKADAKASLNNEEKIKDLRKILDKVAELEPQWERAQEIFDNPLGSKKSGAAENALNKLIARLESGGKNVGALLKEVGTTQDELVSKARGVDNAEIFRTMTEESRAMNASMVEDTRDAARAKMLADNTAYENRINAIIAEMEAVHASEADIKRWRDALSTHTAAAMADIAMKTKSPMQKMASEWQNVTRNMEEATARWGQSTVDTILDTTQTGGQKWRFMADMILKDFAKLSLQKALGDTVSSFGGAGVKLLGAAASDKGKNDNPGAEGGTGSLLGGAAEVFKSLTTAGKNLWDSFTGTKNAVSDLATDGIAKMAVSAVTSATEETAKTATAITATTALAAFTVAVDAATMAAAASAASSSASGGGGLVDTAVGIFAAANGGILGEFGSVPLRKYARGGIARSPQLALYGEAGPEAYVPLPDGRSIPVTMTAPAGQGQGQGVGNVTIQINVDASGGDGRDTQQQGDMNSAWGQIAQKVRSVVVTEISTQQRPGGLLYR